MMHSGGDEGFTMFAMVLIAIIVFCVAFLIFLANNSPIYERAM